MSSFDETRDGSGEGQAPAPRAVPPPVPPPLFPTDRQPVLSVAAPAVDPGSEAPTPPKKGGSAKLGAGLAVGAAVLGAILVKFVLPVVLVGVAGGVFGSVFGGPYMQLPGDVRSGFEARLETALGDSFDDLPEDQQTVRIEQLLEGGMSRLADGIVAENLRLTAKAVGLVDDANCANLAIATFAGSEPSDDAANALVGTLEGAELQQWFEVRIAAVEAEVRGSPAQVLITDAAAAPLYPQLAVLMSETHIATLGRLDSGETVEDAAQCSALRGLYDAVLRLPAADLLLYARYDVTP